MVTFYLNGSPVSGMEDKKLMTFLREDCGITSVKNGCDMGVCGACTVLIDGVKKTACRQTLAQVAGRQVLTVEGLSTQEQEVYSYAFGKAGAVQCGYCIPGMVLSAKALLDRNPDPDRRDIKQAIRGNLCRCTGYVKIEQAILLAAAHFRNGGQLPVEEEDGRVGGRFIRLDAADKVLGRAAYCDDLALEGMLYGAVLRAEHPRAVVQGIDTTKAKALAGVRCVLTAEDIPGGVYDGYLALDWPVLVPVGDTTHYIGDALAIVAADTAEIAREAVRQIEVRYEVLSPVTTPQAALEPDAPKLHTDGNQLAELHIIRGDVDKALQASAVVLRETFSTPYTEHAFMEPESTLAYYDSDGRLNLRVGTQNIHHDAQCLSRILNLPVDQIRVHAQSIGGAFGGKEDLTVQHHAALLCYYTHRPVKLTFTREESLRVHPKRHPMTITLTLGLDKSGQFTALRGEIIADTGAYASLGAGVMRRAVTHMCGPYRMPNVDLCGCAVYTNNPPSGAFRGFGVAQSAFALETCVDMAAQKLGLDRFAIRWENALEPGDHMGTGQICTPDTAIKETLLAVKETYEAGIQAGKTVGIACAIKNAGIGMGMQDTGRAILRLEDGQVVLYSAAVCIGQGLATTMAQIAAQTLDCPVAGIKVMPPDTAVTLDTGATTGSRQTILSGEAVRQAALQLKADLAGHDLSALEGRAYTGIYTPKTDPLDSEVSDPQFHVSYGYATHLAVLDDTGQVERIVAAHDIGQAINPLNVEGQIEGGVVMGMGYALTERFQVEEGYVKSNFAKLGLLRATDIPEIETVLLGKPCCEESYGAKGVGEIATIPTAPAIASAYNALQHTFQHSLPLENTPYSR